MNMNNQNMMSYGNGQGFFPNNNTMYYAPNMMNNAGFNNNFMGGMNPGNAAFNGAALGVGGLGAMGRLSQSAPATRSLGTALKGFKYGTFLDSTQKTLTTINQLLPIYHQITPMFKNAGVMFKVANAMKSMPVDDTPNTNQDNIIEAEVEPLEQHSTNATHDTSEIIEPITKIENPKFF